MTCSQPATPARNVRERRKPRFRLIARLEPLEGRALLTASGVTFYTPPLTDLLKAARNRQSILAAGFNRMVGSLRTQIESQVNLAAYPAVPTGEVVRVVDQEVAGFEAASRRYFAGPAPGLNRLLQLQGQSLRYEIRTAQVESNDGLPVVGLAAGATLSPYLGPSISTFNVYAFNSRSGAAAEFQQSAFLSVQELALSRKLWPRGTPPEEYLIRSLQAQTGLNTMIHTMENPGSVYYAAGNPFRTPGPGANAAAAAVVTSMARAFKFDMQLATTQQPRIHRVVTNATARLVRRVNAAQSSGNFLGILQGAASQFDAALVGRRGLFGPKGAFGRLVIQPPEVPNPLAVDYANTFAELQYTQELTATPTVFYRYVGSSTNSPQGVFLTPTKFQTGSQAVAALAIDQSWFPPPNTAAYMVTVTLPASTRNYVGLAGPFYGGIFRRNPNPAQYPGGAIQVVVNSQDRSINYSTPQKTGT